MTEIRCIICRKVLATDPNQPGRAFIKVVCMDCGPAISPKWREIRQRLEKDWPEIKKKMGI